MKKVLILFFLTLIFLSNCAQNVRVKVDPEYNPEVRIISNQDYPEIKTSELLQKLTIEGKDYAITVKKGKEVARIPKKYLKALDKYNIQILQNDFWNFNYFESDKILNAEPKNYKVPLTLLRQNPKKYDKNRPFIRDDLKSVELYYKDKKLTESRYLSKQGRPDIVDLKIPTFPEILMDDYSIKIDIPGYETYNQKIIDIQNKTVKLKLRQGMLKFKFVNIENSMFDPGFIFIENKYNKIEKYSSLELKKGISIYDVEFPVKLFSKKGNITIFDEQGNKIDTLVVKNAGFFDMLYKENFREFPAIFYDLSEGKANPDVFEKWVNNKKNSSEGIFLFVTNGYEKVFNSNPDNIINVTNKIYRLSPRTSNVLESINHFSEKFKSFTNNTNLNDEEVYGTKMTPKFYIFLSDENVERLQFAVDRFVKQIHDSKFKKDSVVIFLNPSQKNSSIIQQLKDNNLNVQIL